jgi:hypothetical protein
MYSTDEVREFEGALLFLPIERATKTSHLD